MQSLVRKHKRCFKLAQGGVYLHNALVHSGSFLLRAHLVEISFASGVAAADAQGEPFIGIMVQLMVTPQIFSPASIYPVVSERMPICAHAESPNLWRPNVEMSAVAGSSLVCAPGAMLRVRAESSPRVWADAVESKSACRPVVDGFRQINPPVKVRSAR